MTRERTPQVGYAWELIACDSPEAMATAAATRWLAEVSGSPACVAISGGRSAALFFKALAAQVPSVPVVLQRVHWFWADERCVPPTDPESNYGLAKRHLLDPLEVPTGRVHRLRGEIDPPVAAQEMESELRRCTPADADGLPVLDYVFLGMGEDGHVASLFPGAPEEVIHSPRVYLPVVGPKPPPHRLTLTYHALAAAREVWVLVSGPGKAEVLRASLGAAGATPLARLLSMRNKALIMSDFK